MCIRDRSEDNLWRAVEQRDKATDGKFVYGVLTTGVYCRPSCSSRQPRRENVRFFASCRLGTFKQGLKKGANVTTAMMDAGYSSTSRLYEQAQPQLGMAPRQY